MPFAMVRDEERVHLVVVNAGRSLQARLAAIELVPGVEIEVVQSSFHGPFIVAVRGCRIVLGRGITQKVIVT